MPACLWRCRRASFPAMFPCCTLHFRHQLHKRRRKERTRENGADRVRHLHDEVKRSADSLLITPRHVMSPPYCLRYKSDGRTHEVLRSTKAKSTGLFLEGVEETNERWLPSFPRQQTVLLNSMSMIMTVGVLDTRNCILLPPHPSVLNPRLSISFPEKEIC